MSIDSKTSFTEFTLDPKFLKALSERKENFGFNGLGRLIYYRTYSRLKEDGMKECWWETVQRVVEGTYTIQKKHIESLGLSWNEDQGQRSAKEMAERMFDMKFLPPGRGLWAMGSKITKEKGLFASLSNCAFVSTRDIDKEPTKPFEFLMDMSMLGIGVGFDSQGEGKVIIKKPILPTQTYVIPDTREGWVSSLKILLESYFHGRNQVVMDYTLVRPAGEPLKVFGGISSGPGPLKEMHEDITKVLDSNIEKHISIRVINDLMNLIGKCVVSGNIRRSSEISFGPANSEEFINLKNYEKNPERAAYGWSANNSIYGEIGMDYASVSDRIADNGEPGLIWLENMRAFSRINGEADWKDTKVMGSNPCLSGDTMIFTTEGFKTATDLIGKQFTAVINGKECPSTEKGFWCTGRKELFKITLKNGQSVRATDNHRFLTDKGQWEEVKNLRIGSKLTIPDNTGKFAWSGPGTQEEGYFIGQLIGDGTFYTSLQAENCPVITIWVPNTYDNPMDYKPYELLHNWSGTLQHRGDFKGMNLAKIGPTHKEYRVKMKAFVPIAERFGVKPREKKVFESGSREFTRGMLQGFFDADGSVMGNTTSGYSLRLAQTDVHRLESVQRLLLGFGIYSVIYRGRYKKTERLMPDGKGGQKLYTCQESNELVVSSEDLIKFRDLIGLQDNSKSQRLDIACSRYTRGPRKRKFVSPIVSIESTGTEDVFDCTIPDGHAFAAGGFVSHNCSEISLEPYELCNLSELFPTRCTGFDDFIRTIKFAYLYSKTVSLCNTHWPETNAVLLRNRRIGCSISGIAQFISAQGLHPFKKYLEEGYKAIQNWDKIYSDWLCIPRSIKTTTIKPSGSVSLLAGVTPGVHYPISRFYTRRVRIGNVDPLLKILRDAGYKTEPCVGSEKTTSVVEIPIDSGTGVRPQAEVSMWEQIQLSQFMQRYWADNQVSVTVTFQKSESKDIARVLDYAQYGLKGVSFLPYVDPKNSPYPQMPYEPITEQEYHEALIGITSGVNYEKLNRTGVKKKDAEGEAYCDGDKCVRV